MHERRLPAASDVRRHRRHRERSAERVMRRDRLARGLLRVGSPWPFPSDTKARRGPLLMTSCESRKVAALPSDVRTTPWTAVRFHTSEGVIPHAARPNAGPQGTAAAITGSWNHDGVNARRAADAKPARINPTMMGRITPPPSSPAASFSSSCGGP